MARQKKPVHRVQMTGIRSRNATGRSSRAGNHRMHQ